MESEHDLLALALDEGGLDVTLPQEEHRIAWLFLAHQMLAGVEAARPAQVEQGLRVSAREQRDEGLRLQRHGHGGMVVQAEPESTLVQVHRRDLRH